jgi:hypothetical protein
MAPNHGQNINRPQVGIPEREPQNIEKAGVLRCFRFAKLEQDMRQEGPNFDTYFREKAI